MPNKIQRIRLTGTIAADGTATAYSNPIQGKVLAVQVDYPAHACTVDIDTDGELVSQKIMDIASASTDVTYYPRTNTCDYAAGATMLYSTGNEVAAEFVVTGRLKLSVASGTAADVVTVDVILEEF